MLHGRASQSHHLRGGSLPHSLQRVLVQVSRDPTLLPVGAACLQGACPADFRWCRIVHGTVLARELLPPERLLGRAKKGIGLLVVVELGAIEQCAVSLI